MARRKPDDDDDGGLDSLLDTMTNVVGILVLVLIVTQMSVAEVVTRITTENKVDAETLAELKKQLAEKEHEQSELESMLIDPFSIDAEKQLAELERKKDLLERRRKLLEEKEQQKNEFAIKVQRDQEMAQRNLKEIEDTETKRKELQSIVESSLERVAELKAKLDRTPQTEAPADIEVSIPNPRPPPQGSKQLLFWCKNDQVYPILTDPFRELAEARARQIIARRKLDRDPEAGIDPKSFTEFWQKLDDTDAYFNVKYEVTRNRYLRLKFVPRDGKGASDDELKNPRSQFRKAMATIDPTKAYARFFVAPDSFGAYVTARRVCSDMDLLAGWQAVPETWEYSTRVPGDIELGPPQPKEPTKPATPRKPANLID